MSRQQLWTVPPIQVTLQEDDVHVWRVNLAHSAVHLDRLSQILSADELARGKRFRLVEERRHFLLCRGLLRVLLGSYLNAASSDIRFSYGAQGKPALDPAFHDSRLQFNLSHSSGVALYAVALHRRVGIDVEAVRALSSMNRIAERIFSERENQLFRALPIEKKPDAFFQSWARKEAFIKATGEGLAHPLEQIEILLPHQEQSDFMRFHRTPYLLSGWSLYDLAAGPGVAAAFIVEGENLRVSRWECAALLERVMPRG